VGDLTKRGASVARRGSPKGLAFEVADLAFIRDWADLHDCRMVLRLDHGINGEEYEEVIAFHGKTSTHCYLIMWRNVLAVFVQPLIGRVRHYGSIAEALDSIDFKAAHRLSRHHSNIMAH
jgi:hypothetical protein